jgi:hypothetical protein
LTFTPEAQDPEPVQAETTGSSVIVRLAPGSWQISAQGWNSKGDWETAPEEVILRGVGTVQVRAGEVQGTQVLLYPVGTGAGVLRYDLQVPGDTVSALLRVYPLPENPDALIPVLDLYLGRKPGQADGTLSLTGSLDLPGGFYRAALDLSRETGNEVLNLRKNDTVHIYDSLTTTGAYTFTPEQFVPGEVFTDLAALQTHLAGLPENTQDTPYLIRLKVDLADTKTPAIFEALSSRYTALDLRGSTGTALTGSTTAQSLYLVSLTLPEDLETLGDSAFASCYSLKYVSLPESLTTIGNSAFRYAAFSSIRLPSGVVSLGDSAFANNTALQRVDLSGLTLQSLGRMVFDGCSSLEQALLPSSLPGKTLPERMFYQCKALKSLNLPQDIETIGASAFYACSALSGLELPATVKTIGHGAFSGCSQFNPNLESLIRLETLENSAFFDCTALSQVSLPASLTAIGISVFQGCTGLTLAAIPESLASLIDYQTFALCRDLQFKLGSQEPSPLLISSGVLRAYPGAMGDVSLPEGIKEIAGGCFRGMTGLTQISLPASLQTIGVRAFQNCSKLLVQDLPPGSQLTAIGSEAFRGTIIETFTLPAGLTAIGDLAFYDCGALQNLACQATAPPDLGESVFTGAHANLNIYVPDGSVAAYKTNWTAWVDCVYGLSTRP